MYNQKVTQMICTKDIQILSSLRKNGRESLTNLSKALHIPISTVYERLKQHEKGIIKKHTTIIDFAELGYGTRATITLKAGSDSKEELKAYLVKHYAVNSVFKINSGFEFLIDCIFKNMNELETFLELLDNRFKIKAKQVYYVIEDVKREEFLTDLNQLNIGA